MNGEKLDLTFISASSEYSSSYPATNAFDGSTTSYWRTSNSSSYPQNIVVGLDDFYCLCGFRLYVGTLSYRANSFKILISSDGLNFDEIYSDSCSSSSSFLEFEFPNTLYSKYVKIEFTGSNSTRLYVYEFELYGIPALTKYLLRSDSTIYTITDNVLNALELTELTEDIFQTYGINDTPELSVILGLTNPEILYWTNRKDFSCTKAIMTALPYTQSIVTNLIDISHPTIIGINSITGICEGSPLFSCEFNGVWKEHNGINWVDEVSGMTLDILQSITSEQWD